MADIENARIRSTFLGIEDHGLFATSLGLAGDGWGQSWGPFNTPPSKTSHQFLKKIIEVVGVTSWEELPGKYVRIRRRDGLIKAIGNLMEDVWLDAGEFWKDNNKGE